MLWSFIHKWHKNIGITSAIFVVMLSITGLMLNHTESLEMNKHFIQNKLLLDLYDIGPRQEPHGFKVGAHWIIQIGERVYFNKTQLMDDVNKLLGVVPTSEYLVVAVDNQILLLTKSGQVIERLTGRWIRPGKSLRTSRSAQRFGAAANPSFIAGVVGSPVRSERPLIQLRHAIITAARSSTAFDRRPNAIVSRRWCAWVWRQILWSRSTGNIAPSRTNATEASAPGPRSGFG